MILEVEAVKKQDFKLCSQSSFCARNRALKSKIVTNNVVSPYTVLKSSLNVKKDSFEVDVENINNKVKFNLNLKFYKDGITRLHLTEKEPIKPRYDEIPKFVLDKLEPSLQIYKQKYKLTDSEIAFDLDNDKVIKLQFKPLKLEVVFKDEVLLTFNDRSLFNFEHYRVKPKVEEKKDFVVQTGEDQQPDTEVKDEELKKEENDGQVEVGLWEETFNGHTDPKVDGPSSIGIDLTFNGFNDVYGIPQHATNLSLKATDGSENSYSEPYRLYNLDVFEYEVDNPMALYGSVPFMVGHKIDASAGVLFLNGAEMWIDIEKQTSKNAVKTHWIAESGVLDLFLFVGTNPKSIIQQYTSVTGTTALPTIFALGYHQCRWNYLNQADVHDVDKNFDVYDIPYDVLWLDIEHTDGKKYFTWDLNKFPDPKAMQNDLASRGRKMVTIVDPHIKREVGYYVFDEATKLGYFVKDNNGADFEGWCWPGSSSWVDYTNPAASQWWQDKFKLDQYQHSTSNLYVWNDMNEPSVFNGPEITMQKDRKHFGGFEHRNLHNLFGSLFHRATAQGLVQRSAPLPARRPFVLSRAFFSGTQRTAAIWTGDNAASWEHLEIATPMLLSISLAGISFAGADVGGFFGNPDPALLVRWYQAAAFQPFFRGHAHIDTARREPWLFGKENTKLIRAAIRERYSLIQQWYTLFFEASINGIPPLRPLFLEFPQDKNTFALDDQFMVGDSILVKPVTKSDTKETEVYLPGNQPWFEYYSLQKLQPGTHKLVVSNEGIPTYLRAGTITIKKERIRRSASLMIKDPVTLLIVLNNGGEAEGKMYFDDNDSYDYLDSHHVYKKLIFKDNNLRSKDVAKESYKVTNPLTFQPIRQPANQVIKWYEHIEVEKIIIVNSKFDKVKLNGQELDVVKGDGKMVIKTIGKLQVGKDFHLEFE